MIVVTNGKTLNHLDEESSSNNLTRLCNSWYRKRSKKRAVFRTVDPDDAVSNDASDHYCQRRMRKHFFTGTGGEAGSV